MSKHEQDHEVRKELYKQALRSVAIADGPDVCRQWAREMIDSNAVDKDDTHAVALAAAIDDLADEVLPHPH